MGSKPLWQQVLVFLPRNKQQITAHGDHCSRVLRANAWCIGLSLVLALSACGLKTQPKPRSQTFPGIVDLKAWQRGEQGIVAWTLPPEVPQSSPDKLIGFDMTIDQYPFLCATCPPQKSEELEFLLATKQLHVEDSKLFFAFALPSEPISWAIQVRSRYTRGAGVFSNIARMETPASVPAPVLRWKWLVAPGNRDETSPPSDKAELSWNTPREKIVRTISKGTILENEFYFSTNVYTRRPDENWPMIPLNEKPLKYSRMIVSSPNGEVREYQIRLVDQSGNEGEASTPIMIQVPAQ